MTRKDRELGAVLELAPAAPEAPQTSRAFRSHAHTPRIQTERRLFVVAASQTVYKSNLFALVETGSATGAPRPPVEAPVFGLTTCGRPTACRSFSPAAQKPVVVGTVGRAAPEYEPDHVGQGGGLERTPRRAQEGGGMNRERLVVATVWIGLASGCTSSRTIGPFSVLQKGESVVHIAGSERDGAAAPLPTTVSERIADEFELSHRGQTRKLRVIGWRDSLLNVLLLIPESERRGCALRIVRAELELIPIHEAHRQMSRLSAARGDEGARVILACSVHVVSPHKGPPRSEAFARLSYEVESVGTACLGLGTTMQSSVFSQMPTSSSTPVREVVESALKKMAHDLSKRLAALRRNGDPRQATGSSTSGSIREVVLLRRRKGP